MPVIISPAKKMVMVKDSFPVDGLPRFPEQAEQLKRVPQAWSPKELQGLWKCNDAIAKLNVEWLEHMDLRRHLIPTILFYEGIQYRLWPPALWRWPTWTISGSTCESSPGSMASCALSTV